MPFEVQSQAVGRVLVVRYWGEVDEPTVRAATIETATVMYAGRWRALLVDTREITTALSLPEIIRVVTDLEGMGLEPGPRMALLMSAFEGEHEFFESAAYLRGHRVRSFTSEQEARAWLEEDA